MLFFFFHILQLIRYVWSLVPNGMITLSFGMKLINTIHSTSALSLSLHCIFADVKCVFVSRPNLSAVAFVFIYSIYFKSIVDFPLSCDEYNVFRCEFAYFVFRRPWKTLGPDHMANGMYTVHRRPNAFR